MGSNLRIRRLERGDRREGFHSGDPQLDTFLREYAGQNQFRHHIAATYVAVEESTREVLGYLTVSAGSLESGKLGEYGVSSRVPYEQVPVLRVARMAVDERLHGSGLGSELLRYALQLALVQSKAVGCVGVVVDAKPGAVSFYEQFGFRQADAWRGATAARPRHAVMFLSLARVLSAYDEQERPHL